jgi:hypothetical protein
MISEMLAIFYTTFGLCAKSKVIEYKKIVYCELQLAPDNYVHYVQHFIICRKTKLEFLCICKTAQTFLSCHFHQLQLCSHTKGYEHLARSINKNHKNQAGM